MKVEGKNRKNNKKKSEKYLVNSGGVFGKY